jgi:predicted small secreted protein
MVKLAILPLIAVFVLCLTACNTVQGVGEDVEAAGEGLQDVAD